MNHQADYEKEMNQYSLILLAGGKSSRMGSNKAELTIGSRTFIQLLLEKAQRLELQAIYVSGMEADCGKIISVRDIFPERGPLGGIHACMREVQTLYCLVLPVDVPQIPIEVLENLLECHAKMEDQSKPLILKHGERRENLIGIYPTKMVDYIENLIKEHSASVHGMLESWGYECCVMDIMDWQVENINTRENYEEILKRISEDSDNGNHSREGSKC